MAMASTIESLKELLKLLEDIEAQATETVNRLDELFSYEPYKPVERS